MPATVVPIPGIFFCGPPAARAERRRRRISAGGGVGRRTESGIPSSSDDLPIDYSEIKSEGATIKDRFHLFTMDQQSVLCISRV